MAKRKSDQIKAAMSATPPAQPSVGDLLPTGSTLFNLALSGHARGGLARGKLYLWVGQSESGKSWMGLTTLAEASINSKFDDYRLIFTNVEDGALMDIGECFGDRLANRIEVYKPKTVQELFYQIDDQHKEGKPFINLVDSMDALDTLEDEEQFQKSKKAFQSQKEAPGSFGVSKAKLNSSGMRGVRNKLEESGSIVILIAQERTNIGFGSQFQPKTRGGGTALKFYATNEAWFSIREKITRKIRGRADTPRHIGNWMQIRVQKNRQTGQKPVIEIPIYHKTGVDDVGSLIHYLITEKHWAGNDTRVTAPEFDFEGDIEELVTRIESESSEPELRALAALVWSDVEKACHVVRKSRYGQEKNLDS